MVQTWIVSMGVMLYSKLECTVLVVACALISLALTSLLVYYYVEEYALDDDDTIIINHNITNTVPTNSCTNDSSNATVPAATLCSVHGVGFLPNECTESCAAYSGSICTAVLRAWASCANGNELRISPGLDQASLESNMVLLNQFLGLASVECQQVVLPLVCLYKFPLCDCTSLQRTVKPTQEMCQSVRDSACRAEWIQVDSIMPHLLPDCSQLPPNIVVNNVTCNLTEPVDSNSSNETFCMDHFIKDPNNNYCWASCRDWKQDSDIASLIIKTLNSVVSLVGLLMTIITLGFSIYEYRKMFTFPLIYLTFMSLDYLVEVVFALVSIFWPEVYCSHDQLELSINNPTTFCTLSGIVFQYTALQIGLFCVFLLWVMFQSLYFPEAAKGRKLKTGIHLTLTLIGFIAPGVAIGICYCFDDFKYVQSSFPALFCTPNNFDYWLYSFVIPYYVLLLVGSYLFILILWHIQKYQGLFRQIKDRKLLMVSNADKALQLISMSVLFFGVVALVLSVITGTQSGSFMIALLEYFACEREGHVLGKCSRNNVEGQSYSYLLLVVYSALALFGILCLNFVILNWRSMHKAHSLHSSSSSTKSDLEPSKEDQFKNRPISTHSDINKAYELDAKEILY